MISVLPPSGGNRKVSPLPPPSPQESNMGTNNGRKGEILPLLTYKHLHSNNLKSMLKPVRVEVVEIVEISEVFSECI
jgi:hypothetical protein